MTEGQECKRSEEDAEIATRGAYFATEIVSELLVTFLKWRNQTYSIKLFENK
jgi:hypothetical protein